MSTEPENNEAMIEAILADEALWLAMEEGLSDTARARLGDYTRAIEELHAAQGSRDMLC